MIKALAAYLSPWENQAEPPEWIHLLPAGEFRGADGRGPYFNNDVAAVMAASLADGNKLPLDINHAIDLAAGEGEDTPAQGWIVAMESRDDGIWGRVEWTAAGDFAIRMKSYGFISPVFLHTLQAPYTITQILRAALVNNPNLKMLKSLHSQNQEAVMLEQLRKALGLPETATEADVLAAVSSAHSARSKYDALLKRVGGLVSTDGDETAVVTALQSRLTSSAAGGDDVVKSLNSQIATLNSELATIKASHAQDRAISVIDEAIKTGKLFPALRDHYIARHAKNPTEVEEELKLLPSIHSGSLKGRTPPAEGQDGQLTEEDRKVAAMMGVSEEDFLKNRKLEKGA